MLAYVYFEHILAGWKLNSVTMGLLDSELVYENNKTTPYNLIYVHFTHTSSLIYLLTILYKNRKEFGVLWQSINKFIDIIIDIQLYTSSLGNVVHGSNDKIHITYRSKMSRPTIIQYTIRQHHKIKFETLLHVLRNQNHV